MYVITRLCANYLFIQLDSFTLSYSSAINHLVGHMYNIYIYPKCAIKLIHTSGIKINYDCIVMLAINLHEW